MREVVDEGLQLHATFALQGLPLGSGLGSSAASAAAAAWAVNGLFGKAAISKQELIVAGLEAEAAVSGYHADNVGPSLMGGFILIRCVRWQCPEAAASPGFHNPHQACAVSAPKLRHPLASTAPIPWLPPPPSGVRWVGTPRCAPPGMS